MSNSTTPNTAMPNVCAECGKRTNKVNRSLDNPDLCNKCFEIAGLENGHADGHHEDHFEKGCPDCDEEKANDLGEIDPIRYEEPETVHIDTIRDQVIEEMKAEAPKQAHFDHSACDHPKTAKDRAQCRKTGPAAVFHGVLVIDEEPAITEMIDREDRTGAAASEADFDLDD